MAESTPQNKAHYEADRLIDLEKDLDRLQRRLRRESRVTVSLSAIVLVALSAYFVFGYMQFSELLRPNEIVAVAAGVVDANIPPARDAIQQEISRSAPVWAAQLSAQAIASAPELREQLEQYVVEQSEDTIEQFVHVSRADFKTALREHHDEFQQLITDLSSRTEASDEVLNALEAALNAELGADMQANAADVLRTVGQINGRLLHLSVGQNLTQQEQQERQTLMLFRRIQMQEARNSPSLEQMGLLTLLTGGSSEDSAAPAHAAAGPTLAAAPVATSAPVRDGGTAPAAISAQKNSIDSVDRLAAAQQAEDQAKQAAAIARAAVVEQNQAADAARAATDLAREAANEARAATLEARLARDELREAEKSARAAIAELRILSSGTRDAESDDGSAPADATVEAGSESEAGSEPASDPDVKEATPAEEPQAAGGSSA
jgi:hypothetical protein